MKQRYRYDDAMIAFKLNQNSFQARQRLPFNSYFLAEFKVWPRLRLDTRRNDSLDGGNFSFIDRNGNSAAADHRNDARRDQDRQALLYVKLAEKIPREQWSAHLPKPPAPAFLALIGGI